MRKLLETEKNHDNNTQASLFHKLTSENIYFEALDTKDALIQQWKSSMKRKDTCNDK